jgi:Mg-chelatase subunit ChlI
VAEANQQLKRTLKFGPALSRELRADYTLAQADLPARRLRPEVISKIKNELARLDLYGDAKARDFVQRMRRDHPELQGEN